MTPFEITKPIKNLAGGALDANRGPYLTVEEACLAIPSVVVEGVNFREGKQVDIGEAGVYRVWWWQGGYEDADLVEMLIKGDPGPTGPAGGVNSVNGRTGTVTGLAEQTYVDMIENELYQDIIEFSETTLQQSKDYTDDRTSSKVYVENFRTEGETIYNDYETIQRAIDSLGGVNATISLQSKREYITNDTISLGGNGQIIDGNGATIVTSLVNKYAFAIAYNNCEIWCVNFGNTAGASSNFVGSSIVLQGTDKAKVLFCTFDQPAACGILGVQGTNASSGEVSPITNTLIADCNFYKPLGTNQGNSAILFGYNNAMQHDGNTVRDCFIDGAQICDFGIGTVGNSLNFTSIDNIVKNTKSYGTVVYPAYPSEGIPELTTIGIKIKGGSITNTGYGANQFGMGVYIINAENVDISNLTVRNANINSISSPLALGGITISSAKNVTLDNVKVFDCLNPFASGINLYEVEDLVTDNLIIKNCYSPLKIEKYKNCSVNNFSFQSVGAPCVLSASVLFANDGLKLSNGFIDSDVNGISLANVDSNSKSLSINNVNIKAVGVGVLLRGYKDYTISKSPIAISSAIYGLDVDDDYMAQGLITENNIYESDGSTFTAKIRTGTTNPIIRNNIGISDEINVFTGVASLALLNSGNYTAISGNTTWTLPPIAGNEFKKFVIMNYGSGIITVNSNAGGNDIWTGITVASTLPVTEGQTLVLYNNSGRWFRQTLI